MYADYTRLETALRRLLTAGKPTKGVLGYTVGGVYSVAVPNDDARYYVRFPDGSFAAVAHRGHVAPLPDLPVEVGFDSAGDQIILGGDPHRPGDLAGTYEVGLHGHERGSGMEFAVDPRLLTPVRAAPDGGLVVRVEQGAYFAGSALRWWAGGSLTLTPPGSANTWAWIIVGIDASGALAAVSGAALVVSAPLDPSTLPALVPTGMTPLAAVRVRSGQTELDEADFEDLRFVVGARTGDHVVIREEAASGTDAGTFTDGSWQTRALNTVADDSGGVAALNSSQLTLAAGTYRLRASAPAYEVGAHQARWYNVSDSAAVLVGTVEHAASAVTRSIVAGRFTITAPTSFELQHRCAATRADDGFGVAGGFGAEVYAQVELWRA